MRGDVYTGNKIVQESGSGTEDITDIRIVNGGNGFTSLPTAVVTSSGGSGAAKVIPYGAEVGRLLSTKTIESGKGYEGSPSPTLKFPSTIIIKDKSSGNYVEGETITGLDSSSTAVTATFVSFDSSNNLIKVKDATGAFAEATTITGGSSSITAIVLKNDLATATLTVGAVVDTAGTFLNEDGHLSETTMKVPAVSTTAPTVKVAVAKSFFKTIAVIDEDPPVIVVASAKAPVASFTFIKLLDESNDTNVAVTAVELESKPVIVSPST
jgi:hypothetical protein